MSNPSKGVYSTEFLKSSANEKPPAETKAESYKGDDVKRARAIVSATTAALFSSGTGFKTIIQWLFFLSVGALAIFIFLVFLHYAGLPIFAFTADDQGMIPVSTAENKQITNIKTPAIYSKSYNYTNLYPINVTFGCDIKVESDFTTTVPRVLWYRAKGYVVIPADAEESELKTLFPDSNVIFYLDPLKNDLKIFLQGTSGATLTETCIENVPIGSVFRINFVILKNFVEVYFRGSLVKTVILSDNLLQTAVEANVFGPPQRITSIKVANATYWPYIISPTVIRIAGTEIVDPSIFA